MLSTLDDAGSAFGDLAAQRHFERTSGLPWHRTVRELASEHGVKSWRDFDDAVFLDAALRFGFAVPLPFRHRLVSHRLHYPAYEFQAEWNLHGDYRSNHLGALHHLTGFFQRSPRIADVSNCLRASWEFGLFEVSVATFPPPAPGAARLGNIPLYETHPDLWQVANLTVESRLCAYREPVSLDLSDGYTLPTGAAAIGSGDFLTNRLLSSGADGLRVWRDRFWRDHGRRRIGVANRWGSIIRPWLAESRLVLHERTPARGGGSASLDWDGVELLRTPAWDGLRDIARQAAAFFEKSLETSSEPDE